jgi:hypothetical protein
MNRFRHGTKTLALTLALILMVFFLPSTPALAGHGGGGGHAGGGATMHAGHHAFGAGYGGIWGGYYPSAGYYGYGYGGYGGYSPYWNFDPSYFGYAAYSGDPYFGLYNYPSGSYQSFNFMNAFQ